MQGAACHKKLFVLYSSPLELKGVAPQLGEALDRRKPVPVDYVDIMFIGDPIRPFNPLCRSFSFRKVVIARLPTYCVVVNGRMDPCSMPLMLHPS